MRIRRREQREARLIDDPPASWQEPNASPILDALQQLPWKMRRALELRHLKSLTTREAAQELGVSSGAYRTLCTRARKRLREG